MKKTYFIANLVKNKIKKEKTRNCCYCGKDAPMSEWDTNKLKDGTITYHHKNCKWKSPI